MLENLMCFRIGLALALIQLWLMGGSPAQDQAQTRWPVQAQPCAQVCNKSNLHIPGSQKSFF